MRKQIITLTLSAAIFITAPLFAMEGEDEHEKRGLGNFHVLPNEALISVLKEVPIKDVIHAVSLTSKAMSAQCQAPELWKPLASKLGVRVNSYLNIRDQLKNYYETLFRDPHQTYPVSMITLQSFRKDPILDSNPVAYNVPLGKQTFRLTYLQARDAGPDSPHEGYLNIDFSLFDKDALVVFSKKPEEMYFQSQFTLLADTNGSGGVIDHHGAPLYRDEYQKRMNECGIKFPAAIGWRIIGCTFTVEKKQQ